MHAELEPCWQYFGNELIRRLPELFGPENADCTRRRVVIDGADAPLLWFESVGGSRLHAVVRHSAIEGLSDRTVTTLYDHGWRRFDDRMIMEAGRPWLELLVLAGMMMLIPAYRVADPDGLRLREENGPSVPEPTRGQAIWRSQILDLTEQYLQQPVYVDDFGDVPLTGSVPSLLRMYPAERRLELLAVLSDSWQQPRHVLLSDEVCRRYPGWRVRAAGSSLLIVRELVLPDGEPGAFSRVMRHWSRYLAYAHAGLADIFADAAATEGAADRLTQTLDGYIVAARGTLRWAAP